MKVFVSSTAEDLTDYRKVADDTILRLSQESLIMERFGPRPGAPIEECERAARESDVTICIVAHRYGSIPEEGGSSFTQREVEAAHKAGKQVLAWIVADDYKWTEKKEQDLFVDPTVFGSPARQSEVQERIRKLVEFKAWLSRSVICEPFTTPDDLGRKIAVTLQTYIPKRAAVEPLPQHKISIARLPTTGSDLFGREAELKLLDDAWANPNTNIVSFVAWGGVGKTALVNHWLKQHMARDNYRGAERVYGWSFFSQGTSERVASADLFIDQALRWFGEADPTAGSPWDKGERLANYIRQSRTLLILDGLEPLQYPPGSQEGRLKDPALQALLVELAAKQPGLCVISTRERIGDLIEFEQGTVIQHDLEVLSLQAGAQILRALNVKGDTEELQEAAKELGGHALSLTLLGSYLDEVLNGDVGRRYEIENLFDDTRYGDAAQKMIAAYERWLGDGMELAILRLLGLFNRPAELASLVALREPPVISELTEALQRFKGREWNQAVAKLRRIKLLDEISPEEPGTLDTHPLIREHFKQQLKHERPQAWREANNRLYEYLKNTTKEFPDTIEEMVPLYIAVAHACSAGNYTEALNEVYRRRIQRGPVSFITHGLGAPGIGLETLSDFFEMPWDRPVRQLEDMDKGFVLNEAGNALGAAGRLREALQATQAACEIAHRKAQWSHASTATGNLSTTYLIMGDFSQALSLAQASVELADRGRASFDQAACRAVLANVLHQFGEYEGAGINFVEGEQFLREHQPDFPLFMSVAGYTYCDWLLTKGDFEEVKERVAQTLEWARQKLLPLARGLDHLSLGRAFLFEHQQNGEGNLDRAAENLYRAVQELRQVGAQRHLAAGLLAEAELHRLSHDLARAEQNLEELHRIATRSEMDFYLTDYHLESARLLLARGANEEARLHTETARQMIDRMGYHRRDKEVAELEAQLA